MFSEILFLLMVYIGSGFFVIEEVVLILEKGDIIIYYLNGKVNNLFDNEGKLFLFLMEVI